MHVIYAIKARIYTDDLSCLYRKYSLFPFKYNTPHCPPQSIHLGPSNPTLTWLNCFRSFQFGSEKKPPQVNPFNYHHKKAYSCTELLPKNSIRNISPHFEQINANIANSFAAKNTEKFKKVYKNLMYKIQHSFKLIYVCTQYQ